MNGTLLLQAILVGIFAWLAGIHTPFAWGITGGFYTLGRPLVAGLIIGIIFGDVQTGVLCGVAVQAAFIANISTGGSTNSEIGYAGYGGIGLALASGASPEVAVSLSLLVGSLGLVFYNFIMLENSIWNQRAAKAAKEGNTRGMWMNHVVFSQICHFLLRGLPIILAIYYGSSFVENVLQTVPVSVTQMLTVLGGLLPALGVALLMNLLIKDKIQFIFFIAGFVILNFITNSMIALAVIALMVAYLVYLSTSRSGGSKEGNTDNDLDEDGVL